MSFKTIIELVSRRVSSRSAPFVMDLTGFMFGNINEQGELENDELLDKVKIPLWNYNAFYIPRVELVRLSFPVGNSAGIYGNRRGRCS